MLKGRHAHAQLVVWDNLVEMRIRLQVVFVRAAPGCANKRDIFFRCIPSAQALFDFADLYIFCIYP